MTRRKIEDEGEARRYLAAVEARGHSQVGAGAWCRRQIAARMAHESVPVGRDRGGAAAASGAGCSAGDRGGPG